MTNMCDVLDRVEERGYSNGEKNGFSKGKFLGQIQAYVNVGLSEEKIAEVMGCSLDQIQKGIKQL